MLKRQSLCVSVKHYHGHGVQFSVGRGVSWEKKVVYADQLQRL